MPTLCPCKGYEGWGKGVQKEGEARECPPYAHASGMKDGERVAERREKPGNAHPMPMQVV